MSVTDSETFHPRKQQSWKYIASSENSSTNGVKLPDTAPTITPEQVRERYTHLYPEIATAAIEGPETVAGKLVYKFIRAIGAKE